MSKDTLRQFANLLSVVLALTVNILASALPLNGQNTGEISDRFKVFFVPAGYVFAIWGIIYLGWIAFTIYQFMPAHKDSPRLRRLGYLFALSCVANAAWLFCWHYNQFGLSVLVMLSLLGLLIASYLRLDVSRTPVSSSERWCVDIPFGLYLGWITVATVANIADWLYLLQWSGWGLSPQVWAVYNAGGCQPDWVGDGDYPPGRRLPVCAGLGICWDRPQTGSDAAGSGQRLDCRPFCAGIGRL